MAQVIQGHDDEWVLRIEWTIDDIRQYMDDSGADSSIMTDNDCINVLKIMANNHDAEIGISWDSVDAALQYYFRCISDDKKMHVKGVELKVGV